FEAVLQSARLLRRDALTPWVHLAHALYLARRGTLEAARDELVRAQRHASATQLDFVAELGVQPEALLGLFDDPSERLLKTLRTATALNPDTLRGEGDPLRVFFRTIL